MRILLLISNPQQAAYRLRWQQLLPQLAQRGIQIDVQVRPKGFLQRWKQTQLACQYDAVIIQRKLLDRWEARRLRRNSKRIVFDVDDAVMFHAHQVSRFSQWRQTRRFQATARILDLVIAGNEYLVQQFSREGCTCRILPTTVDLDHYLIKDHQPIDPIRLVWIGSRSTLPYLQEFLPYLEKADTKEHPLELITIADATVTPQTMRVRHIPWSLKMENRALVEGDIGIAPTPQDPWAMGKCGFKIIQYMASSLPVIASPVGANATIIRDNQTGLLPPTGDDWIPAIHRLAADVSLRREMGAAGRQDVVQRFSTQIAVNTLATWLTETT